MKGFDEYMNLVLDDAEEVHLKTKKRRPLGNNVTSINRKPMPLFFSLVQNYICQHQCIAVLMLKLLQYIIFY